MNEAAAAPAAGSSVPTAAAASTFTITLEDSRRFAALSGDFNPLHLDPVAARRLILGTTVPHGVHVLLAALDAVLPPGAAPQLTRLRANFALPAGHGRPLSVAATEDPLLRISVRQDGTMVQSIEARLEPRSEWPEPRIGQGLAEPAPPQALDFATASVRSGHVPVGLDRHRLRELFPVLAERLPVSQLAFVLTATRVVGMECPGLHSILSGLDLTFDVPPATAEPAVAYRVVRAEPRLSLLRLELTGPGATGVVTALVRPPPVAQAGMEDLAPLVPAAAFESQRALVVGGSRGLGEVTAKILALGGADVRISFAQGEADAACVAEEIVRHGGRCSAFRFDVTAEAPDAGAALLQGWTPTHLYYFASPPIRLSAGTGWDRSLFERYCDYYLDGLRRSMTTFVPEPDAAGARLAVVYPSTAFLDEARPGAQEYAAAKAAGEALCRSLAAARPGLHVFCPRLPPLRTDQTSTLRGRSDAADPVPVLLPLLREVAAVTA